MKLGIIGYGRMGQAVETLAQRKGHQIVCIIKNQNDWKDQKAKIDGADVLIEFTQPEAAFDNLEKLMEMGKTVVCGTTGWLEHYPHIVDKCLQNKGAFLYASNFSIGVNIMFELNKQLAKWTYHIQEFDVSLYEAHHIHKKDSPSGTGITLLQGIIENNKNYHSWSEEIKTPQLGVISVEAVREGEIFGIHQVSYRSQHDLLSIQHEALSRDGFAGGALLAAEWLIGRQGVFTMRDVLGLT